MPSPKSTEPLPSASLSARVARRLGKSPAILLVELFVAVSLTVNFFYLVRTECLPRGHGNLFPFYTFSYLSKYQGLSANFGPAAWRDRVLAPVLSSRLLDSRIKETPNFQAEHYHDITELIRSNEFQNLFGLYHSAWVFLCFLALILFRQDALLVMLGVFAGLMYNLTPAAGIYYYPWDMPALFFFTLACLLYDRGWFGWLLPVIILGALFKETVLCCSLFVLLGAPWDWPRRIAGFGGMLIAAYAANELLKTHFGMGSAMAAAGYTSTPSTIPHLALFFQNVQSLFRPVLNHVIFANAGALFLLLLLPRRNRRDVLFRVVILIFAFGQFWSGVISEVRIWYELLPLGWMLLSEGVSQIELKFSPAAATAEPAVGFFRKSYWGMVGALAVTVVALLGVGHFLYPPGDTQTKTAEEVLQELTAAAQTGDAEAQFNLGSAYNERFDPDNALIWFKRAAEQGHREAQFRAGMISMSGDRRDYAGAIEWFHRAAAQGHTQAARGLGMLYWTGKGGTTNADEAVRFLLQAARKGDADAELMLSDIYRMGTDSHPPDLITAYQLAELALIQGRTDARDLLRQCAALMTADQIAEAERRVKQIVEANPPPH